MNLAIWDIESSSSSVQYASIVEIGGVLINENFKEIDRFNLRCRLPEGEVPMATALLVNKTSVDLLTKANLSHYQMLNEVEKIFKKWSPAIFLGWSNIGFDDEMIRNEFFRGIRYPYITNTSPNKRHDGLNIAQAAYNIDNNILQTENTAKGNISMRLESLARMNGMETSGAHSALFDAELVMKVLSLIKKKQPHTWNSFLRTANSSDTETIIKKEKMFTFSEFYFGKGYLFLLSSLHPKACMHQLYPKWAHAVDLKFNIEPLLNLSVSELRREMKRQKFLRTIKINKAPILLEAKYAMAREPYSNLDPELIKKRAELVKSNEKFSQNILTALREIAEEKEQLKSQVDIVAEESIYTKFTPTKDTLLFPKWHAASWKDKLGMLDKFEDERMVSFGKKIIFQESPETLPTDMLKSIRREIAKRILSTEDEKFMTCYSFYNECDNLREKHKDNEKTLKILSDLNDFVMSIEKKYREA